MPTPPSLRVITWNLFHGRSLPPARGALSAQFAAVLSDWEWDVALLQEVPPWWPAPLAGASGAEHRTALTSRNSLLALRRALASRWPELMRSNGGGCNAILVRGAVVEHRAVRLRVRPERRVAQLARLADGTCVANYHGSARVALAEAELARLWELAFRWAHGAPLVLGGDLNLRAPDVPGSGIVHVGERDVDHLFARGLRAEGGAEVLGRVLRLAEGEVELSDHPPLRVSLRRATADPGQSGQC
jgi:endonuclease/exonuclease/phosphatase family metal-dependent hydrolase